MTDRRATCDGAVCAELQSSVQEAAVDSPNLLRQQHLRCNFCCPRYLTCASFQNAHPERVDDRCHRWIRATLDLGCFPSSDLLVFLCDAVDRVDFGDAVRSHPNIVALKTSHNHSTTHKVLDTERCLYQSLPPEVLVHAARQILAEVRTFRVLEHNQVWFAQVRCSKNSDHVWVT